MQLFKYKGPKTDQYPFGFYSLNRLEDALQAGYKEYISSTNNIEEMHIKGAFIQFQTDRIAVQKLYGYLNKNLWKPYIDRRKAEIKQQRQLIKRRHRKQQEQLYKSLKERGFGDLAV